MPPVHTHESSRQPGIVFVSLTPNGIRGREKWLQVCFWHDQEYAHGPLRIEVGPSPGQGEILEWAQDDALSRNETPSFEDLIEAALSAFVRSWDDAANDPLLLDKDRKHKSEKTAIAVESMKVLMRRVLEMRLMWRVASCSQFWGRYQSPDAEPAPLHEQIADWLRKTAEIAISKAERRVAQLMTAFFTHDWSIGKTGSATRPRLYAAMNAAAWIVQLQLLLLYRASYIVVLGQEQQQAPFAGLEGMSWSCVCVCVSVPVCTCGWG